MSFGTATLRPGLGDEALPRRSAAFYFIGEALLFLKVEADEMSPGPPTKQARKEPFPLTPQLLASVKTFSGGQPP